MSATKTAVVLLDLAEHAEFEVATLALYALGENLVSPTARASKCMDPISRSNSMAGLRHDQSSCFANSLPDKQIIVPSSA